MRVGIAMQVFQAPWCLGVEVWDWKVLGLRPGDADRPSVRHPSDLQGEEHG